jgi:hypothetical protein
LVLLPMQAGGTHSAQALAHPQGFDVAALGHNTASSLHLIAGSQPPGDV